MDALFGEPRLAAIYDLVEGERRGDLDHYLAIAAELGARSLLDVGCGTGTLACRAASQGMDVTGVDPAAASLDVAATLTSDSTRRFWSRAEIEGSLRSGGYVLADVRDAPDRPGYEWVFIARKPG
jgi:2-polyprenyl-3-methyl-5-hydroxy-6-metoxy-1,4-benzoquinol methylase